LLNQSTKKLLKRAVLFGAVLPVVAVGALLLSNGRVGVGEDLSASVLLATPPAPLTAPVTLKVATFNIQDLYLVGKDRPLRMRSIGAKLLILDPDIVGFQEAFIEPDRALLLKELESTRLKHHQYYPSGTVGSGLLIASAFPIKEVYFHRYSASNPFYKIGEGDWWAGKGVALARLELPEGHIDFYNTHAQAGYGNPAYDLVRGEQMAELADFIRRSHCGTAPALLAGDMNCRPGDAEFEAAVNGAGLQRVMLGESRIDHLFARTDERYVFDVTQTEPIEAVVKLGEKEISLSDHTGYMSTITIRPAGSNTNGSTP
jgi:endonuclease/exonuclease/phosphatase family metal-dependent hydrolase